jgi:predicted porin
MKMNINMNMNKSLLALAVLATVASTASAQTNVTLYGMVDAGIDYDTSKNPGGAKWALQSGQQSSSRIGFKGSEDLGNGMTANFVLENGFQLDDGTLKYPVNATTPRLFGRQAWVSLDGAFGSIKLGRQYSAMFFALGAIDPFGVATSANAQNVFGFGLDAMDPISRSDNTISYTTPTVAGFNALGGYKFGENAGAFNTGSSKFVGVTYANGPLLAVASFQSTDNVSFGAATTALGAIVAPSGLGAVANTTGALVKTGVVGATYDFGVAKVALAYGGTKATAAGDVNMHNYLVGFTAPAGTGSVLGSWLRNDITDISGAVTNMYSLGYKYPLSKRTGLYAYTSYTRNGSAVRLNAQVNGQTDRDVSFGVNHKF